MSAAGGCGRVLQAGVDGLGADDAAVHRQPDAGRKHRVDEGVGIAEQQVVGAVVALGNVGEVAGRLDFVDQFGVLQALGQRRAERDAVSEELFEAALAARLHVVRPGHHADAGDAVLQRDEPEPAVLEPENGDVAFRLARVAPGAGEVAIDRRAVVARVALLDLEAVGEEGVAAGGVDDEARLPFVLAPVVVSGTNDRAAIVGQEIDRPHLAAFMHLDALARRVADQHVVEFGALDLVGVGHRLVPGLGELEGLLVVVMRRDEFGAPLLHADGPHLVGDAELLEQRQVGRQQRFADVEARMAGLVEQHHLVAHLRQQRRHRRSGRPAADHQHVAVPGWCCLSLWFHGQVLANGCAAARITCP